MANDIDMWKDIKDLENNPKTKKQSRDLLELFYYRYNEYNPKKVAILKKRYIKKYGDVDNYI